MNRAKANAPAEPTKQFNDVCLASYPGLAFTAEHPQSLLSRTPAAQSGLCSPNLASFSPPTMAEEIDPSEFVQRIRQLGEQRDQQDAERVKKLEEELMQGRSERLARRAGG